MAQAFMTGHFLSDQDMADLAAYFSQQPARCDLSPAEPKPAQE